MSPSALNLIKLVVGVSSVEELAARQKDPHNTRPHPDHKVRLPVVHTRTFPRQSEEILKGGSLYRVISGLIQCRQTVLDLQTETRADGTQGTLILLSPEIIRVEPRAMRPFQGWRYLKGSDAPLDLSGSGLSELPPLLQKELTLLGL
ncbi:DUF1489 domain-containing protein [Acetobacter farinalis]|uniref:DUF1489 domain-containing protein n=1 Tax=Acetobacter farinalis TaxID=1260984 RepID=A0ABT3Q8N9_9PROT|nr:DUF1489 domain-containing protein [Acetobacter farinalis]MCX2561639.1 DUF1489 domain-containing protein [Acetobacter farinalis]NHO30134.1 DUF1489 family protein [Acetobacter farinalis]